MGFHVFAASNNSNSALLQAESSGAGTYEEAHHELFKITTEVTAVHLAYTLIAVFTVVFGIFSAFIKEKLYAGEAIIALCVGIGFGPYGANIFSPTNWASGQHFDEITLEITRVVIALAVFAVGVELPRAYIWKHWRSLAILLGPVMFFGWMFSALFIFGLIPGLGFLDSLVIAACVTPTDPILAASVVGKGKFAQEHVPAHIRHILQAESGSNDGAAFPFLYFAMFWLLREGESVGHAVGWWIALVVLYQIVLGIIIGAAVGIIARKMMKFAKYRDLIDRESMVAMYVALALLVTGATTLAGSDDLLAAFACGTAFAWDDWFSESIEDSNFSSILDLLVNCAIFFYIGATIPFDAWSDPELTLAPWRLVVIGILILLFRRIPVIFLLQKFVPDIRTMREAIFVGHFGPMGVGALFIATLARSRLPTPNYPPESRLDTLSLSIEPIVYFLILCSTLVHGLSIPVFTNGRRLHKRVSSFSRTFTAGSTSGGDNEPSWLSRVRRMPEQGQKTNDGSDDDRRLAAEDSQEPESTPSSRSLSDEKKENNGEISESDTPPHDMSEHENFDHPAADGMTEWREGDKILREDASGEQIHVYDAQPEASTSARPDDGAEDKSTASSMKLTRTRTGDSQKNKSNADEPSTPAADDSEVRSKDHYKPAESQDGPSRKRSIPKLGKLWKRDEETGVPRELSQKEKNAAKMERDVRKERHYCGSNEKPAVWREGNRIVVESKEGEVLSVREVPEDQRVPQASPGILQNVIGAFPGLTRLTTAEHRVMTEMADKAAEPPHNPSEAAALDETFRRIEEGRGPVDDEPSKSENTGKRPILKSLNTAALRDRLLRRRTVQEDEAPAPEMSQVRAPMPERSRVNSDARAASIRFNLPRDDQVKRYDLAE